jgi:hypothetical protein
MKVYCVFHYGYGEVSLVGVYASSVKAHEECDRLNKTYASKLNEHWVVDEHEVIES